MVQPIWCVYIYNYTDIYIYVFSGVEYMVCSIWLYGEWMSRVVVNMP